MLYYKNGDKLVKGAIVSHDGRTSKEMLELYKSKFLAKANEHGGIVDEMSVNPKFFKGLRESEEFQRKVYGGFNLCNPKELLYLCDDDCDQYDYLAASKDAEINIMYCGNGRSFDFKSCKMAIFAALSKYYNTMCEDGFKEYEMLYPALTEMFAIGCQNNSYEEFNDAFNTYSFDMTKLIGSDIKNLEVIKGLLSQEKSKKYIKDSLKEQFPEFALFYYSIAKYLKLQNLNEFSIEDLKEIREKVAKMGLDTKQYDQMLQEQKVAEQNTQILQFVKKIK